MQVSKIAVHRDLVRILVLSNLHINLLFVHYELLDIRYFWKLFLEVVDLFAHFVDLLFVLLVHVVSIVTLCILDLDGRTDHVVVP